MANLNDYQTNEAKGRTKFANLMKNTNTTLTFTEDDFNYLDAFFTTSTDTTYGVEIKNRDERYEHYDTFIMEKIKYDAMERKQNSKETKDCWMVYFFGNHAYIYKWSTINTLILTNKLHIVYRWLPNSTVNKYKLIQKPCYELPKIYSYQYEYTSTTKKWTLTNKPNQI